MLTEHGNLRDGESLQITWHISVELTWQIHYKQHGRFSINNMADPVYITWQIQYTQHGRFSLK